MYPDRYWFCAIAVPILFMGFLCGAFLILAMTFARFYSIIRPLRAAAFNTTRRAKITIASIVAASCIYNIPHFFTTSEGTSCLPYGNFKHIPYTIVQFYYWFSFVSNVCFPFVSLLVMNTVIIKTIRNRFRTDSNDANENQTKNADKQMIRILLLVTFSYLALTTPGYVMFLLATYVNFQASPKLFSDFILLYSVVQKLHFTNNGINFFLYVISGKKFRNDLFDLFTKRKLETSNSSSITTSTSQI